MLVRVFPKSVSATLSVFVILASSILWASQAYAQVAGATLTGTVKDPSSATIPNAQVAITDAATGVTRTVTTDSAGLYTAPNLLPGTYEVRVTATGFSTHVQRGITLTVGAQQVLDVTMQVGQVSQTVEVTTEAPTVELTSSTLSATVNATTVRELPLNGRSWTDLASLQPGVVSAGSHGSGDANRGYGKQVSISGGRPQQNNYRVDGISINDYANGGPGNIMGGNLGVDAIEEFSVLTSNYSAEYGKTSGGVVNAITRPGTNSFHGSAYEFIRNSGLDARNFFDGPTVPPFKRNQFGASAGAPIRKDKTFIFGDYESVRQSLAVSNTPVVLSPAARNGTLNYDPKVGPPKGCAPISGSTTQCQATVDPLVAKFLGLEPLPNAGLLGIGNTGTFKFAGQQVVNENYFTFRVDQNISDKDKLFGTYSFDTSPQTQPNALDTVQTQGISKRDIVALEESHIFSPSIVNSVRVGYNRAHAESGTAGKALNPLAADPSLGWAPGLNATSAVVQGIATIGPGVGPPGYKYIWNSYQVYDDAFVTKGLHSLKFGGGFEADQLNETTYTADFQGIFSFKSLTSFLTNNPARFAGAFPQLIAPRYMRTNIFGAYLQDDWRVRPNLTLNLGVRYEMATAISEATGKLSNLPTISAANPRLGSPWFENPTLKNVEPRVGFSWDPFKNGKTAVRGGFGLFDVLPLLYTTLTMTGRGAPFISVPSTSKLPQGSFPQGAFVPLQAAGAKALEYDYVDFTPHRNYVMQWNLNVQRQLGGNLTAVVGYVGSRAVHQPIRVDDANMVIPTLTSAGYLWPNPIPTNGVYNVINPNVGAIRSLAWAGDSFYDALEVGILKRMSHGLQIQGSFTWGKSIDNESGATNGDTLANAYSSPYWFDLKTNRAVSDFNIGRVLVINGSWRIPSGKLSGPAGWVANGWELGGILKVNDGIPFTMTFGQNGDPLGIGSSDPWAFPNLVTGPGCATLTNPGNHPTNYVKTQCFAVPTAPSDAFYAANCDPTFGTKPQCFNLQGNEGRNVLRAPGLVNLDFSLFKNNYVKKISENFNAQFRLEVFNILNHANFSQPAVTHWDVFDSTGAPIDTAGLLTSTTTTSRQIQFALKFTW
jgi:hypothetical protein